MKKPIFFNLIAVGVIVISVFMTPVARAQTPIPDYTLRFNRDFGYGAGSNVRGTFSLAISGDLENISQVTYFIDGQSIGLVTEAPFKYQFNTDSKGYGWHDLSAEIVTKAGEQVPLAAIRYNFISAADEKSGMAKILIPIGGVVVGVLLISFLIQYLTKPKKLSAGDDRPRDYGMMGGTICPKCGHPFPRSLMGINLVVGRLERCESCKKFVMTVRASPEDLYKAEMAEKAASMTDSDRQSMQTASEKSKQEKAVDDLDQSRYMDDL